MQYFRNTPRRTMDCQNPHRPDMLPLCRGDSELRAGIAGNRQNGSGCPGNARYNEPEYTDQRKTCPLNRESRVNDNSVYGICGCADKDHMHDRDHGCTDKDHMHDRDHGCTDKDHMHDRDRGCADKDHMHDRDCGCVDKNRMHDRDRGCADKDHMHDRNCGCADKDHMHERDCGCVDKNRMHDRDRGCTDKDHMHDRDCGCVDKNRMHDRGCRGEHSCENSPTSEQYGCTGLAMAFVPKQEFTELNDAEDALCRGTLFRKLDMPFYGSGRRNCK